MSLSVSWSSSDISILKDDKLLSILLIFSLLVSFKIVTLLRESISFAIKVKMKLKGYERPRPQPLFMMLGQTHMNGWNRVIVSQNGGSTSYIFPFILRVLQ